MANLIYGTDGSDTLIGIGSSDVILPWDPNGGPGTDSGNDSMSGLAGDDVLAGSLGADTLDGGTQTDTADYSGSILGTGVGVSLFTGLGNHGEALGDSLISIENLIGTKYSDVLIGNVLGNVLWGIGGKDSIAGGGGNDTLVGGAGPDTLDGGPGIDTADYSDYNGFPTGISVSLLTHVGTGGDAQGDSLVGIENLTGTRYSDALVGDDGANSLMGWAGSPTAAPGRDSLSGGGGNDSIDASSGPDSLGGGPDSVNGGAGIDNLYFTRALREVSVDLNRGFYQIGGEANPGTVTGIENVFGSIYADTLIGDSGANLLSGGGTLQPAPNYYADDLRGGPGADTLIGGPGHAIADYFTSTVGVKVSLLDHTASGGDAEGDSLIGVDFLSGSPHADSLVGDDANNSIYGAGGADSLMGGNGNDTLEGSGGAMDGGAGADSLRSGFGFLQGGAGADTLSGGSAVVALYTQSPAGVNVSLLTGHGLGGDAQGDSLIGVKNITGSDFNDTLIGDDSQGNSGNRLAGGAGSDVLYGLEGPDTLNGGSGTDAAVYDNSRDYVVVSLQTHTGTHGAGAGDSLIGIENVFGSRFNDSLTGDGGANVVNGANGADSLDGGGGADTVRGALGDDQLTGGAGNDRFIFVAGDGQDVVTDFHHAASAGQEQDKLDLIAFHFASAAAALSHASSDGTNTYFDLDGNPATHEITLLGVTSVDANDVLV